MFCKIFATKNSKGMKFRNQINTKNNQISSAKRKKKMKWKEKKVKMQKVELTNTREKVWL